MPKLPLRKSLGLKVKTSGMLIADKILDSSSYRSLLESMAGEAKAAIAQFDEVFGERA
jgi:hypothetical protein